MLDAGSWMLDKEKKDFSVSSRIKKPASSIGSFQGPGCESNTLTQTGAAL
jgi:hypothetical protein